MISDDTPSNDQDGRARAQAEGQERRQIPTFDVAALVAGEGQAVLVHGSERYRLRITAKGKLILTK